MPKAKATAPKKSSAKSNQSTSKNNEKADAKKASAASKKAAPLNKQAVANQAKKTTPLKASTKSPAKVSAKSPSRTSNAAAGKSPLKGAVKGSPIAKTAPSGAGKLSGKSGVLIGAAAVASVAAVAAIAKAVNAGSKKAAAKSADASKKSSSKLALSKGAALSAAKNHHMPAAPSSRMTLLKLGYSTNEQAAILAAPHGFKIPDNADEPATLDAQYDFILVFVENITEAEVICASLNPSLRPKGRAWVAWPKGGASDINLDQLSGMVEAEGLRKIAHLSIDERWSAAKFMHPKSER